MKNWFFALLKTGQGFFEREYSIELPLWVFCIVLIGLYLAGYLVGKF